MDLPPGFNVYEHREQQLELLGKDPADATALAELICADCLICEENIKDLGPGYMNSKYCEEILLHGPGLIDKGMGQLVATVCSRAADSLWHHPRLKLRLMRLEHQALKAIGEADDDLDDQIALFADNIMHADRGELDQIRSTGHLKSDPVEWTERFEQVIDLAEERASASMGDAPRGMGFCHGYWPALAAELAKLGVEWRSPARMNPRVMFD